MIEVPGLLLGTEVSMDGPVVINSYRRNVFGPCRVALLYKY